jgi:hypothetical protein
MIAIETLHRQGNVKTLSVALVLPRDWATGCRILKIVWQFSALAAAYILENKLNQTVTWIANDDFWKIVNIENFIYSKVCRLSTKHTWLIDVDVVTCGPDLAPCSSSVNCTHLLNEPRLCIFEYSPAAGRLPLMVRCTCSTMRVAFRSSYIVDRPIALFMQRIVLNHAALWWYIVIQPYIPIAYNGSTISP